LAYFTPEELPDNKYYLFGKEGAKNLAEDLESHSWEEYLLYNPYAKLEIGRPAAMQTASAVENILMKSLVMLYKKR
jgi:ATP-binding protein involved in chromosome partitioning